MWGGKSQDPDLPQPGENVVTVMCWVCRSPCYGFPAAEMCSERASGSDVFQTDWWGKIVCTSFVLGLLLKVESSEGVARAGRVSKCLREKKRCLNADSCAMSVLVRREAADPGDEVPGRHGPAPQGIEVF